MRTFFYVISMFAIVIMTVAFVNYSVLIISPVLNWLYTLSMPFVAVGIGFIVHTVQKDYRGEL